MIASTPLYVFHLANKHNLFDVYTHTHTNICVYVCIYTHICVCR